MMFLFKRNERGDGCGLLYVLWEVVPGSNSHWKEGIIEEVCICTCSLNVVRISEIVSDCCLDQWGNQFSQITWRKPIHNFVEYD